MESLSREAVWKMQLKLTTDYAIRTMLYLAIKGGKTSSGEISEKMQIPQKFLLNILTDLRKAGLVQNFMGVNGGFSLAARPEEISLLQIIEITEGTTKINRCLEEDEYCSRFATVNCPVRKVYVTIQSEIEQMLGSITLASMMDRSPRQAAPAVEALPKENEAEPSASLPQKERAATAAETGL